jgi:hypothetical protein
MSGSAAGDALFVVSTREVSCGVRIETSPPFGIIQWNLRFVAVSNATSYESSCRVFT